MKQDFQLISKSFNFEPYSIFHLTMFDKLRDCLDFVFRIYYDVFFVRSRHF